MKLTLAFVASLLLGYTLTDLHAGTTDGSINCGAEVKPLCPYPMKPVCVCRDLVGADCVYACGTGK